MFEINFMSEWSQLGYLLTDLERRQLPFATARALTQTAKAAQTEYRSQASQIFDRPTAFTVNALYVRPAKKDDLRASVEVKDEHTISKGTPAEKFLAPEILGGGRRIKRFERRISRALGLPDTYMVPGRGAQIDRFGNISRGQLVKIISAIGGLADVGANANAKGRNRGSRRKETYFVAHSKRDGEPLGIWQIVATGQIIPVLVFLKKAPSYSARFDFTGLMTGSYKKNFERLMTASFEQAVKSARK